MRRSLSAIVRICSTRDSSTDSMPPSSIAGKKAINRCCTSMIRFKSSCQMRRRARIRRSEGTPCRTRIGGQTAIISMKRRRSQAGHRRRRFGGWRRTTSRGRFSCGWISSIRMNRGIRRNTSSNGMTRVTPARRCCIRTTAERRFTRRRSCTTCGHTMRVKRSSSTGTSGASLRR